MQHAMFDIKKTSAPLLARMLTIVFSCSLILLAVTSASAKAPEPIQVMIVGAYHMGNPGLDINNVKVDSVLAPDKQKQLVEAVNRLAKFKPNKIAVEMTADRADMTTTDFDKFTPATLQTDANEIAQIAYRLAHQLGHKVVYAIDEQSKTIDYFPYDKVEEFAKANKQENVLAPGQAWGAKETAAFEKAQKISTVRQLLLSINAPESAREEMNTFYYPLLAIGDKQNQPGAELNAGWYQRNAKIFAKLNLAAKPGDKILVLFGAGHNYWLRHFVNQMPGYQLVDVNRYLK